MAEKNLLTLREIAEEIGIRYRTVIDCKNQFNDFFVVKFDGRNTKYPKEYVDLFRLIFALKDEGYLAENIRKIFAKEHPNPPDFDGWIDGWIDGRTDGLMDEGTDGGMDGWMDETNSGSQNSSATEEQASEHNLEEHDIENRLSQLQSDLKSQLYAKLEQQIKENINQQIKEIVSNLENYLLNLKGQINGSITEFYKTICQLQENIKSLDQKITRLQEDLGVEDQSTIKSIGLDLNELQIELPKLDINNSIEEEPEGDNTNQTGDLFADLEFVKNSITEGKPDKEAVRQWVMANRNCDNPISYGEMANRLNNEQIPTLRGKEGWTRSVVRNLAVRENNN